MITTDIFDEYDVFLCHNSLDKDKVMEIGRRLRDRNIRPWLDEWEVAPGAPWIRELSARIDRIRSAAIFIGKNSLGPWQEREVELLINQFIKRGVPVIPVILPDCPELPKLPLFLGDVRWVDFRIENSDPLSTLIWGITGQRPQ